MGRRDVTGQHLQNGLEGVLLVDKPQGLTSHQVVGAVRRLSGQRKAGHSGTLDPLATGLMQIMLGRATKLGPYLTAQDKAYEGCLILGQTTDTDDVTGTVTSRSEGPWPLADELQEAMKALTGLQEQRPPAFSAIKLAGRRAYELARRGQNPRPGPRPVEVMEFSLAAYEPPRVYFKAQVSKGCYIRSLARDLGERLGCGGVLAALRRTRVGRSFLSEAVTLAEAEAWPPEAWPDRILSPARALADYLPLLTVSEAQAAKVLQGRALRWPGPVPQGPGPGPVGLADPKGRLLAVYEFETAAVMAAPSTPPGPFLRPRRVL